MAVCEDCQSSSADFIVSERDRPKTPARFLCPGCLDDRRVASPRTALLVSPYLDRLIHREFTDKIHGICWAHNRCIEQLRRHGFD